MKTEITMERKQKIRGPSGLILELDADRIVAGDPGQDTPCLVVLGRETATFNCAFEQGEMDEGTMLNKEQREWLDHISYAVDTWLTNHSRGEKASKRNSDRIDGYDRDDIGESPDF